MIILYKSNAGHTKAYAEMLAKALGIEVYDYAKSKPADNSDVIYLGWLMGGNVSGLDKAVKKYNVKAVGMVSMADAPDLQNDIEKVNKSYNIDKSDIFVLRGGFELDKLKGIYKFMMSTMSKGVVKDLEKKEDKTQQDLENIEMFTKGKSLVSEDNLKPLIEWYNATNK